MAHSDSWRGATHDSLPREIAYVTRAIGDYFGSACHDRAYRCQWIDGDANMARGATSIESKVVTFAAGLLNGKRAPFDGEFVDTLAGIAAHESGHALIHANGGSFQGMGALQVLARNLAEDMAIDGEPMMIHNPVLGTLTRDNRIEMSHQSGRENQTDIIRQNLANLPYPMPGIALLRMWGCAHLMRMRDKLDHGRWIDNPIERNVYTQLDPIAEGIMGATIGLIAPNMIARIAYATNEMIRIISAYDAANPPIEQVNRQPEPPKQRQNPPKSETDDDDSEPDDSGDTGDDDRDSEPDDKPEPAGTADKSDSEPEADDDDTEADDTSEPAPEPADGDDDGESTDNTGDGESGDSDDPTGDNEPSEASDTDGDSGDTGDSGDGSPDDGDSDGEPDDSDTESHGGSGSGDGSGDDDDTGDTSEDDTDSGTPGDGIGDYQDPATLKDPIVCPDDAIPEADDNVMDPELWAQVSREAEAIEALRIGDGSLHSRQVLAKWNDEAIGRGVRRAFDRLATVPDTMRRRDNGRFDRRRIVPAFGKQADVFTRQTSRKVDGTIVMLLDISGSMADFYNPENAPEQLVKRIAASVYVGMHRSPIDVHVYAYGHCKGSEVVKLADPKRVINFDVIEPIGSTPTAEAFATVLSEVPRNRRGGSNVMINVTDGEPDDVLGTKRQMQAAREAGWQVINLWVLKNVRTADILAAQFAPVSDVSRHVPDFRQLPAIIEGIVTELARKR